MQKNHDTFRGKMLVFFEMKQPNQLQNGFVFTFTSIPNTMKTILFTFTLLTSFILNINAQSYGTSCSDALPIECGYTYSLSTIGSPNDNISAGSQSCLGTGSTGGQIWYSYTATENGSVSLSLCNGTNFDSYLAVFTGECGTLSCISTNDDACSLQSALAFSTIAGYTYKIRVGGFASSEGSFTLSTSCGSDVFGCTNATAVNYDAAATNDDGSCVFSGCTDPVALNYNSNASIPDSSCIYCSVPGSTSSLLYVCTFSNGQALNLSITDDSGNEIISVNNQGNNVIQYYNLCLSPGQCYSVNMSNSQGGTGWNNGYFWINNGQTQIITESLDNNLFYESTFFSIDGTCTAISGCMDASADNYNPNANNEDGSCVYAPTCENGTPLMLQFIPGPFQNECSFAIADGTGNIVSQFQPGSIPPVSFTCWNGECLSVALFDSFGDGWNGGSLTLSANGYSSTYTFSTGNSYYALFNPTQDSCSINIPSGCMNPAADNFDPTALLDDGTCLLTGCTDASALNFDIQANSDDGSCQYCNGEGSVVAPMYICTFSNGNQVELSLSDPDGNTIYTAPELNNVAILNTQLCLQPGICYTAHLSNNTGPFGWYNGYFWIHVNGVEIIHTGLADGLESLDLPFSIDGTCGPITGCTDFNAINYNAEAQINDGSCQYPAPGCTDPVALNYNSSASSDDGSCVYASSCQDNLVSLTLTEGPFISECSYEVISESGLVMAYGYGGATQYGCLPNGCYTVNMYDGFGDGWNGTSLNIQWDSTGVMMTLDNGLSYGVSAFGINSEGCTIATYGCTDINADNYNPTATIDDGSCYYSNSCDGNFIYLIINPMNFGSEISWSLNDSYGNAVTSGGGYTSWTPTTTAICIPDGCYDFVMNDSWGDGWNGGYYQIVGSNIPNMTGGLLYGNTATDSWSINSICGEISGCTDVAAVNYNPAATNDDGSCWYNDNNAQNFGAVNGLEFDFSFYPNPTNDGIIVYTGNAKPNKIATIEIIGIDGRLIDTQSITPSATQAGFKMDLNALATGTYWIRFSQNGLGTTKTLIKE